MERTITGLGTSSEATELERIRNKAIAAGVTLTHLTVDSGPSLAFAVLNEFKGVDTTAVDEAYKRWVDRALALECQYLVVGVDSTGSYRTQSDAATEGVQMLCRYAAQEAKKKEQELTILVESRRGISADGQWLADVISSANMENCGAAVNLAVFPYDRAIALEQLRNHTRTLIIETFRFSVINDETGMVVRERDIDYAEVIREIGTIRSEKPRDISQDRDKPGDNKSGEDKTGDNKPGDNKPGDNKPGDNKPGDNKPGEDKPGADKPGEDEPGADKPGEDKPGENKPGEDRTGDDTTSEDKLGEGKPAADRELPIVVRFMGNESVFQGIKRSLLILEPLRDHRD